MLEIMPVGSKEIRRHICSDLKTDYVPDSAAYCAKSGKRVLALCQFTINGESADILSLSVARDEEFPPEHTARILILSVLSFLDACGVRMVRYQNDSACTVPHSLCGFRRDENGTYYTEINGFFDRTDGEKPIK